jgi:serine/threonine protein kinase/Tfp pilus assembly protein PilF
MKCPECSHANPSDTLFCGKCGSSLKKGRKRPPALTKTLKISTGELAPGTDFAGRYRIIEDLGKGGMGHVYKVLDGEVNEVVALKILRSGMLEDETIIERFHNELKLARRVSHKNVCGVYHLERDENDVYYITMEYVPGEDLKTLIRRIGQLSIGKAVLIAEQICDGLAEAHRLGVIHRDLKPQNIMIDRDGHVRIMDFGIARSLSSKGPTDPSAVVGTPDYMSPEQLEGQEADHRTDIYSLGLILYEMLTGRLPYDEHAGLAVLLIQKTRIPPSPKKFNPHIPDSLCHAVLRCLEKKRDKRFQDVAALREELGHIEAALHLTTTAPRTGKTQMITTAIRARLRWPHALVAAFALGGLLFIGRALLRTSPGYDNYISLEIAAAGPAQAWQKAVEFVLNRGLSASSKTFVFIHQDLLTYKKRTESAESDLRPPELSIVADIVPRVVGFDVNLTTRFRGRTARSSFDCKGPSDFLTKRADDILADISVQTKGFIAPSGPGRPVSRFWTASTDGLDHFLKGEDAWARLDAEQAFYECRTALENDPSFSLSHLRLVDVLVFRSDREAARRHLDLALAGKDRLTDLDLLRLYALQARLDSKPNEERQFRRRLTEESPFRKEYQYEFAESYFHYGAAEEAIRYYLKALELDGNYALAHNHIAYCYSWIGEHDKALAHLQKYMALDPSANSYDSLAAGYTSAGEYEKALAAVREGFKVDPNLDFLYGTQAQNLILQGQLAGGEEAIRRQAAVSTRDITKNSVGFWLAFVEYLKGDADAAVRLLAPSLAIFRQPAYRDNLDESPNLPSWLSGVLAAGRRDLAGFQNEIAWMEDKIGRHSVSTTRYSRIWKLYIHLKILEGALKNDLGAVGQNIEEGRQLRTKMGYWGSFFNMPFFYNLYAEVLLDLPGSGPSDAVLQARSLLEDANTYDPHYARTHLNLARIHLRLGDLKGGRAECALAREILSGSDADYELARNLAEIGARVGN